MLPGSRSRAPPRPPVYLFRDLRVSFVVSVACAHRSAVGSSFLLVSSLVPGWGTLFVGSLTVVLSVCVAWS